MRRINKASLERYFLASSAFGHDENRGIDLGERVHSVHIVVAFFLVVFVVCLDDIVRIVRRDFGSQLLLR